MTEPAELEIRPPKRRWLRNLSAVWLIPILALIVSIGIAWQSYADRGVLIEIEFESAAGVKAGETTLQYRDVIVGHVEKLGFTDDLESVVVSVRVENEVTPYLTSSAQFWIVQPEVSTEGITGLNTVLSGVYIEGSWERTPGKTQTSFKGLARRPVVDDNNDAGTWVKLHTTKGSSMASGAPVFYRGVKVGQTEAPRLTDDGASVEVRAFIKSPHDKLLTTASRFWDASGFNVSFGPQGLKLDVSSLASLVSGGVAFNTFFTGGTPVSKDEVFDLYSSETEARENAIARAAENVVKLSAIFEGGEAGLAPGSPVRFQGLKIGQVFALSAHVDRDGDKVVVNQTAILEVEPEKLGLDATATLDDVLNFLDTIVAQGMRAQLAGANFLGTTLAVDFVMLDNPPAAQINHDGDPYPIIPSAPASLHDMNASIESVLTRVSTLNFEGLIDQAIDTLHSIQAFTSSQELRDAPKAFTDLLKNADGLISSDDAKALPGELKAVLSDLRETIQSINTQGMVAKLVQTLDKADTAISHISTATESVPALIEDVREVAVKVRDLDVERLLAEVNDLVARVDLILADPSTQALPETLNETIVQVRDILFELRDGGAVQNVNETLTAARTAADKLVSTLENADKTLENISTASEKVPALIDDIKAVAEKARDLSVEELITSVTDLVNSADEILDTPAARELPAELNATLFELKSILEELRQGGAAQNVNAALSSARDAAQSVETAMAELPQITQQLEGLITKAEGLVAAYGARSEFNAETIQMLREIRAAARTVTSLARTLERSPNSILFGR